MYPPPPPRGRGVLRTLFTIMLVLVLVVSLLLNLFSAARGIFSSSSGGPLQSTIVDGDETQKIAVIPVNGIIEAGTVQTFNRFLSRAEADEDVKAIVIEVDSPGGTVTASDEIHHRITEYRKAMTSKGRTVPIVVSMGSLAASGGYYIACAADHVVAQPTTMTGNIGVLFPRYNLSKLADEWGVEEVTLESTGAEFKNAGSMFKPEDPVEVAYFQDIIDDAFAQFKDVVRTGRMGKGNFNPKQLDTIANGKIYMAAEALKLGLIDQVGYADDAYAHAASAAGLTNHHVVRFQDPPSLFDVLASRSSIGGARGQTGAVNVQIDLKAIQELTMPRMLYLWRP
jgi:protease-4